MRQLNTDCQCECAKCGTVIDYRSTQAGEVVQCAKCGEKSRLPEPARLDLLKPAGPPLPELKTCAVCGTQSDFLDPLCPACEAARKRKIFHTRLAVCVAFVVALVAAGFIYHWDQERRLALERAKPRPIPHILIAAPVAPMPKSTNDLRPLKFVLERTHGESLATAVGDIENTSAHVHHHLRAEVDLLDRTGAKIGSVTDYFVDLGAHQTWHFVANVTNANAMSIRFAGLKIEE